MTRKLEETFGLRSMKEAIGKYEDEPVEQEENDTSSDTQIISALSTSEKVDHSLAVVSNLNDHDSEMDEIAKEAMESYMELKELGAEQSDAHAARMMEVAANMLRTAMDAKDAKVTRKLKTLDLQLKRLKLEQDARKNAGQSNEDDTDEGHEFNRNDLLARFNNRR